MFFRKKTCASCQENAAELKRVQELLSASNEEIEHLHKAIAKLEAEIENPSETRLSESEIEQSRTPEDITERDERRQRAALAMEGSANQVTLREDISSDEDRELVRREEAGLNQPTENAGGKEGRSDHKPQKYVMSEKDRERLRRKRAGLDRNLSKTYTESVGIENKPKKFTMSHEYRERLREKRAKLVQNATKANHIYLNYQCKKHFPALQRNMRNSVKYNDYGALVLDLRRRVAREFLSSIGIPYKRVDFAESIDIVLKTVAKLDEEQKAKGFSTVDLPANGHEFEHWVAEALQGFGWEARATQGSGDQGVDVVAIKDGLSVGIQCKRYSGSVGNKAVQEAFSGAKHMGLDVAAVLTNAEFTRSAKELSASTGVLLLSPEDIPTLSETLKAQF